MSPYYGLVVSKVDTKTVKNCLESERILNKTVKIRPYSTCDSVVIPTTYEADGGERKDANDLRDVLNRVFSVNVVSLVQKVIKAVVVIEDGDTANTSIAKRQNPLHRAMRKILEEAVPDMPRATRQQLLEFLPKTYCVYTPMLLLPSHVFDHDSWKVFILTLQDSDEKRHLFFSRLASEIGVTHVAINAPIPAKNADANDAAINAKEDENILRSPTNLRPFHGDFGPSLPPFPQHKPSLLDFSHAFWVSTRQNGIEQTWAPRYTMFSPGNVTEKARILQLPSVLGAVRQGRDTTSSRSTGTGCTAVDLFAGVGYFAFSYAKAGVSKVICWDLNPWSVEGFRRGAVANKWSSKILSTATSYADALAACRSDDTFLIFSESNVKAAERLPMLRSALPPIRHVNCGMLPSVGYTWKIAVQAIDLSLGGWLHLHETVAESELSQRCTAIMRGVADYVEELRADSGGSSSVELEHVEWVKSVGPRLWHVVLDVRIGSGQMHKFLREMGGNS